MPKLNLTPDLAPLFIQPDGLRARVHRQQVLRQLDAAGQGHLVSLIDHVNGYLDYIFDSSESTSASSQVSIPFGSDEHDEAVQTANILRMIGYHVDLVENSGCRSLGLDLKVYWAGGEAEGPKEEKEA